jgi:hypothetical protein
MYWTNQGLANLLDAVFRGATLPTNFYVALVTSDVAPSEDTKTLGELTEVGTGTGYDSGGYQLDRNSTDWDFLEEDDAGNRGRVQAKDVQWTASGGSITGARYAVLTDDDGTVANREVWAFWDLSSDRTVEDGRKLLLQNLELILRKPA